MNNEEIRKKIENKYFKSKSFVNHQIWIYSSFSAASLAFFFALFSAGDEAHTSTVLQICVFLFSVSLLSNSTLTILMASFKEDADLIHEINLSKHFKFIPIIAWWSFAFAVLGLILYYSFVVSIITFSLSIFLYMLFTRAMKEIREKLDKEHKLEMEEIKKT